MQQKLQRDFPRFRWHLPLIVREGAAQAEVDEPMVRLREGEEEREARSWDFALAIGAAQAFYGPELIASWAPSVAPEVALRDLAVLAGFVSSLGLVIGSLGASFEGNHYFQHVIYADEAI